jgi:hypothetical protein
LLERAVALAVVAHALGGDVLGVLAVVDQFFRRLSECDCRPEAQKYSQKSNVPHHQASYGACLALFFSRRKTTALRIECWNHEDHEEHKDCRLPILCDRS